jgi:hypothetical protein
MHISELKRVFPYLQVLKRAIKPDPNFSDKLLEAFFVRFERELVMLREIKDGFFSFSALASSFESAGNIRAEYARHRCWCWC